MLIDLTMFANAIKSNNTAEARRLAVKLIPWLINSGHTDREHARYFEDAHYWAHNTVIYSEGKDEPITEICL